MEAQTNDPILSHAMNGKPTQHAKSHTKFEGYVSHTGESFKAENLEHFYVKVANHIPLNLEAIGVEHPDDWEHKPIGHGKRFYYWMVKLKETNELGKDYDYYLRGERSGTLGLGLGLPEKAAFIASCGAEDKKNWYDDVLTNEEHLTHGYLEITKVATVPTPIVAKTPMREKWYIESSYSTGHRIRLGDVVTVKEKNHIMAKLVNLCPSHWWIQTAYQLPLRGDEAFRLVSLEKNSHRYLEGGIHQVSNLIFVRRKGGSTPTPDVALGGDSARKRGAPTPDDVAPDVALGGDSARKRVKTVLEVPAAEVRRHQHSSRVSEYHYLRIRDVAELNEQVNKMIKDGWQPYYGPCSEKFFINQAMVKYE